MYLNLIDIRMKKYTDNIVQITVITVNDIERNKLNDTTQQRFINNRQHPID